MIQALSVPMLLDYMAIVMDKQALSDYDLIRIVTLPDVGGQPMLRVKNGVVLFSRQCYFGALSSFSAEKRKVRGYQRLNEARFLLP